MARMFLLSVVALAACGGSERAQLEGTVGVVSLDDGPRLSAPRATHATVRTETGELLAIGGCVAAGCEPGQASATVDVFSPDGVRLVRTGTLIERRVQPMAVAIGGSRVLVLGGWVDGRVSTTTEIFDSSTGRSVPGPNLARPLTSASLVRLHDARILIAGGYDGREVQARAQIFDPKSNTFLNTGSLVTARSGATASLLDDGRVLIAGGGDSESAGRRALASAELFDPANDTFSQTGAMAQRRYKHGAVTLENGDVLVIAGSDERDYGGKLRSVERYDAARGRFVAAGSLARARFKLADGVMLIDDGRVLIGAGDEQPEVFDIDRQSGELVAASLDGQWNYMTLVPAGKRTALLMGGYREGRIEPTDRSWIVRF
ncbi:Kelch repeat-containing protein [Parerythrobacter lacustris]|uniref:Kelch repeat-containing protein n=1 Tax=Parerythrobacter lacustris TaxID=2969984 RepID=A0ABT1XP14_9SPHN|nr:kelch repeat-containing protein [Parerythrobacter lacustris]MCR2833403.1 kelch repeat-containing protein [Parerythrobacter lacustris]